MSYIEPTDLLIQQIYSSAVMSGFLEDICLKEEIKKRDLLPKAIIPAANELFSDAIKGENSQIPRYLTANRLVRDLICKSVLYKTNEKAPKIQKIIRDYAKFNKTLDTPRHLNKSDKKLAENMLRFYKLLSNRASSAGDVIRIYGEKSKYTYPS